MQCTHSPLHVCLITVLFVSYETAPTHCLIPYTLETTLLRQVANQQGVTQLPLRCTGPNPTQQRQGLLSSRTAGPSLTLDQQHMMAVHKFVEERTYMLVCFQLLVA